MKSSKLIDDKYKCFTDLIDQINLDRHDEYDIIEMIYEYNMENIRYTSKFTDVLLYDNCKIPDFD